MVNKWQFLVFQTVLYMIEKSYQNLSEHTIKQQHYLKFYIPDFRTSC
jgi:hypothetical protein